MSERYKFPDNFTQDQFVKYIDRNEIKGLVESLGHSLGQKYENQELVIIGTLKGAMSLMADLVREIKNVKIYVDFVKLDSVGRSDESFGSIRLIKDISMDICDKNVLLVTEIMASGRSLFFLKQRLSQANPKSFNILTLLDKPYKRAVPLKPEYLGRKIEDHFVVGYGLDLEENGRHFEDIYFLKYPN